MILSTYIRQADAILIVRVFLGILFFLQGYDKVFRIGVKRVVETIHAPLSDKGIAVFFSAIGAYFTSYSELVCGAFLIIGFVKYYCLYILGFDLLFVALAFGIVEPVWDMKNIFPRLALLTFLLVTPSQWDIISIDHVWSIIKFFKSII